MDLVLLREAYDALHRFGGCASTQGDGEFTARSLDEHVERIRRAAGDHAEAIAIADDLAATAEREDEWEMRDLGDISEPYLRLRALAR